MVSVYIRIGQSYTIFRRNVSGRSRSFRIRRSAEFRRNPLILDAIPFELISQLESFIFQLIEWGEVYFIRVFVSNRLN